MAAHTRTVDAIVAEQQQYAATHSLPGVFEALFISLLSKKPASPHAHIAELLTTIQKEKSFSTATPGREVDTEEGAREYLDKHGVQALLEELMANVLFARPAEPLVYLAAEAKRLETSKPGVASMYDEADLRAMFSLYDPAGRGLITDAQVANAFRNLGLVRPPSLSASPGADGVVTVDLDTFLAVTKHAIHAERGAA